MLIATTRSSDYQPWSACAGHPTNKQTHPVGEKEKKRMRKRINEKTEEIFCFILNLSTLIIGYNARLGLSETRLSSIILWPVCLGWVLKQIEGRWLFLTLFPPHIHPLGGSFIVSPETVKRRLIWSGGRCKGGGR